MTTIDAGKNEPLLLKNTKDIDQKGTGKDLKQEPALKPIPESHNLLDPLKSIDSPDANQEKESDKLNQV